MTPSVAVLGAGSWGTALAILIAGNGAKVRLWARDPVQAERMVAERRNSRYLPEAAFPPGLTPTASLDEALEGASDLLIAVPSQAFRATLEAVAPGLCDTRISWATKGLESNSRKLLHRVSEEVLGDRPIAVISGPTFAGEVARGLPTAVTVAANDSNLAEHLAELLHGPAFRAYTSDDVVGVELGGAVKNVLAIAAGIADGLGFGANTRAALITRGLVELTRLGTALGGRPETFMGLAGLGDLVLTCTDDQSRNRRIGLAIGRGATVDQARSGIDQVVEGVRGAAEVVHLARDSGVEMPICEQVYRVLYEGLSPLEAVERLLGREQKAESQGLGARG